jgi:hypothetical protein
VIGVPVNSDHEIAVTCGTIVFTKERLQKFRGERQILAVPRGGVRRVRIHRTSASEYPLRESVWAAGLAIAGVALAHSGVTTSKGTASLAGVVLCALATWMVVHLARRVTLLTIETDQGTARIAADVNLSSEQLLAIRKAIHDQLDWPVVFEL